MEIAKEFSTYVSGNFRYIQVHQCDMPGWGAAACLRVWEGEKDEDVIMRATLAITADIAWCTAVDKGIREIDLRNPQAFDEILKWMKEAGLVRHDMVLSGVLA
jgi:hypothetical protein